MVPFRWGDVFSEGRRGSQWQENQKRRVKGRGRDMLNTVTSGRRPADRQPLPDRYHRAKLEQEEKGMIGCSWKSYCTLYISLNKTGGWKEQNGLFISCCKTHLKTRSEDNNCVITGFTDISSYTKASPYPHLWLFLLLGATTSWQTHIF